MGWHRLCLYIFWIIFDLSILWSTAMVNLTSTMFLNTRILEAISYRYCTHWRTGDELASLNQDLIRFLIQMATESFVLCTYITFFEFQNVAVFKILNLLSQDCWSWWWWSGDHVVDYLLIHQRPVVLATCHVVWAFILNRLNFLSPCLGTVELSDGGCLSLLQMQCV